MSSCHPGLGGECLFHVKVGSLYLGSCKARVIKYFKTVLKDRAKTHAITRASFSANPGWINTRCLALEAIRIRVSQPGLGKYAMLSIGGNSGSCFTTRVG